MSLKEKLLLLAIEKFGMFRWRVPLLSKRMKGMLGEACVCRYLRGEGCRVMSRNWRYGKLEIDMVVRDGEVVVFVEVKSGMEGALKPLYYNVSWDQKRNLEYAAKVYMRRMKWRPKHVRFDIVEVYFDFGGKSVVKHHKNVQLFNKYFQ